MNLACASDSRGHRQPARHKMAALTFVGLVAPVYFIPPPIPSGRVVCSWLSDSTMRCPVTCASPSTPLQLGEERRDGDGQTG